MPVVSGFGELAGLPWERINDKIERRVLAGSASRLTANQRRDLMEIIEDRYGRGSTLITSQLPVEAWHAR